MSDAPPREWRFYVDDMIDCADKVMAYSHGLDQSAFVASGLHYDATVRLTNPQIPWRLVIVSRNRLIQGYLGIDNDTLNIEVNDGNIEST